MTDSHESNESNDGFDAEDFGRESRKRQKMWAGESHNGLLASRAQRPRPSPAGTVISRLVSPNLRRATLFKALSPSKSVTHDQNESFESLGGDLNVDSMASGGTFGHHGAFTSVPEIQSPSTNNNNSNDIDFQYNHIVQTSSIRNGHGVQSIAYNPGITSSGMASLPNSWTQHEEEDDEDNDEDSQSEKRKEDSDVEWAFQKLSSMRNADFERYFDNTISDHGGVTEPVASSSMSHQNAFVPNMRGKSMQSLSQQRTSYVAKMDDGARSTPGGVKFWFPDLFLPERYHQSFFEFMESHDAYRLYRCDQWTKLVDLMIAFLLRLTLRHWAGREEDFPDEPASINLRNLARLWYCSVYSVAPDYGKGRKGRGRTYSEEEIFAIEFGMYKYPPTTSGGIYHRNDFKWAKIVADGEISQVLAFRTKDAIVDKATAMPKEKFWDSLVFFYQQQEKFAQKVHDMKMSVYHHFKSTDDDQYSSED